VENLIKRRPFCAYMFASLGVKGEGGLEVIIRGILSSYPMTKGFTRR